jgi:hypothetical protein
MEHRNRIQEAPAAARLVILTAENEALRRRLAQVEAELATVKIKEMREGV